jgi:hypothetical protein
MLDEQQRMIDLIADRLRGYLGAHPKAADTLEGITEWWLSEEGVNRDPKIVQQALDQLVSEQAVIRTESPDGQILYARWRL